MSRQASCKDIGMSVLILKNIGSEGPGTIEHFLLESGRKYEVVEMSHKDAVVGRDADVLVIMGGPMSVNEEDIYPYISLETALVRDFIGKGKKVLGICLGAQLIAKALGARVFAGAEKEIGWYDIELLEGAERDPLMRRLASDIRPGSNAPANNRFKVFQWHGETFELPSGARLLAKSGLYPHQAFSYGEGVYAFQFHIEVTREMIYEWLANEPVDMGMIREQTEAYYDDYHRRALNFYNAFF